MRYEIAKISEEKALETLDKIEALASTSGTDGNVISTGMPDVDVSALELMIKVARRKGGVELLVKKYAASHSRDVIGALVLILVQRAEKTKPKDAHLLFEFIKKLQLKNDLGILVTTLTSVQNQIGLAKVWQNAKMPENLYQFLQHCLEFKEEQATRGDRKLANQVQLSVVGLLLLMCNVQNYDLNFNESQRKSLEDKIKEITTINSEDEILRADASYFFQCLKNG